VLQRVAVCCSVLQCVAVCRSVLTPAGIGNVRGELLNDAVCCSVLQCVAVCCSVLQCVGELLNDKALVTLDSCLVTSRISKSHVVGVNESCHTRE